MIRSVSPYPTFREEKPRVVVSRSCTEDSAKKKPRGIRGRGETGGKNARVDDY